MATPLTQEWADFRRAAGDIAAAWALPVMIVTDPDPRLFMLMRGVPTWPADNDNKARR